MGVLSAAVFFAWASGFVLIPIIGCAAFLRLQQGRITMREKLLISCMGVLGVVVATYLFLLPFILSRDVCWFDMLSPFRQNFVHGDVPPLSVTVPNFLSLLFSFPFVYIIGIVALLTRKKYILYGLCALCVCVVFAVSFVYVSRMIYLLPYALIGFLSISEGMSKRVAVGWHCSVWGIVVCMFIRFVVIRNIPEYFAKDFRDYDYVRSEVTKALGRNATIYVDTYHLYYIGRSLGWRQYRAAELIQRRIEEKIAFEKLLSKVDWYIGEGYEPDAKRLSILKENGFKFEKVICEPDYTKLNIITEFLRTKRRLSPLGPYCVFKRSGNTSK